MKMMKLMIYSAQNFRLMMKHLMQMNPQTKKQKKRLKMSMSSMM